MSDKGTIAPLADPTRESERTSRRMVPWLPGALITIFWLTMMFTLVRNRILPERQNLILNSKAIELSKLTENWRDQEEYMIVNMNGRSVGGALSRVQQLNTADGGYSADFALGVGLNMLGLQRNIGIHAKGELDDQFDLSRFHIRADLSPINFNITGMVDGEELLVEFFQGPTRVLNKYTMDRKLSLLDAVRPVAMRNFEIKPGNSISIPVVDPIWSMQHGVLNIVVGTPERIHFGDSRIRAYPLEMRLNDFVTKSWVDRDGTTLRRQIIGNLYLDKASEGQALAATPELKKKLVIPTLRREEFAKLPAQKLQSLSRNENSPLSVMNSIISLK